MTEPKATSPTVWFLASLLPTTWPGRRATLDAAARLDEQHEGDGSDLLLDAWSAWQRRGEVPPVGPLRDMVAALAELLAGVGHELRRRPRDADERHGERDG
jgi:hypothetical protein